MIETEKRNEVKAGKPKILGLAKWVFYGGLADLGLTVVYAISSRAYQADEGVNQIVLVAASGLFGLCISAPYFVFLGMIVSILLIWFSRGMYKGVVRSLLGGAMAVLSLAMVLPTIGEAGPSARRIWCAENLRSAVLLLHSYDKEGDRTAGELWEKALRNGDRGLFQCPSCERRGPDRVDFALNEKAAGKRLKDLPGDMVLLFESKPESGRVGGRESLAVGNHRKNCSHVAFADGHVELVSEEYASKLRWEAK